MKKICLVTEEMAGLTRSGGIGACARGLAFYLTSLGYQVDVVVTDIAFTKSTYIEPSLSQLNLISLHDIVSRDPAIDIPIDDITKSYCVYRFVRKRDYDVIHFNDWRGSGFYTAMARRQGFLDARIISDLHGSSE
jgi:glycogen synthase